MERITIRHSDVIEMRRKRYCCDASRQMYEDYYTGQVGGNMPVFRGMRHQRGHGLGNVIIRNVMKTGMEVADDVLEGQSLKSSVKKRLPQGIKRAA